MDKYQRRWPKRARVIPGFHGYLMAFRSTPWVTAYDSPSCCVRCPAGLVVLSAANGNRVTILRPWRYKQDGEEYGAIWVALRGDDGKKKHFRLEVLAKELFGDDWKALKCQFEAKTFQGDLGELY